MARKETQLDEEIIDLTELIEPGDKSGANAAAAYAKAAAAPVADAGEDDFAAILAESAGVETKPQKPVNPDEELDMSDMGGIDNLLESLDIPAQPREAALSGPAPEPAGDDLDSALDDLLGEKAAPEQPAPRQEAPAPDIDSDLDDILASFHPSKAAKPEPETAAKAPDAMPGLDADIDDILADMEEPKPAAAQPKAAAPKDEDQGLDDLLSGVAEQDKAPKAVPDEPDDLLDDLLAEPKAAKAPAATNLTDDLDDLLGEPVTPKAPQPKPAADLSGDELDDLLGEPLAGKAADSPTAKSSVAKAAEQAETRQQPKAAEQAKPAQPPASEPKFEDDLDDLLNTPEQNAAEATPGPEISGIQSASLPAEMPQLPVQAWSPEFIAGLCRNIQSGTDAQETLQEFSRELGAQSAHVEDIGGQLAHLSKRLLACESKLAAARARIAALEKGMQAALAFEDLFKEGTALHNGFMAMITSAVSSGMQENANITSADQEARDAAQKVAARQDAGDSRMDELEKQIESLRQENAQTLEKTVAATVARLLHEEISKLAQG